MEVVNAILALCGKPALVVGLGLQPILYVLTDKDVFLLNFVTEVYQIVNILINIRKQVPFKNGQATPGAERNY